jgi:uncharacterized iron-regulated protein
MSSFGGLALILGAGFGFVSAAAISACRSQSRNDMPAGSTSMAASFNHATRAPAGVNPEDKESFDALLSRLQHKRVVFVGETHDRYDHHLNQLEIIRGLRERGVDLAVGMEFFQEPFQPHLDRYVAGEIGEKALLKRTEYYERWRYDFRHYRDILAYAQANGIPLVALNAPAELVAKVSRGGLATLSSEERGGLPADLSPPDTAYQERLRPIFEMHEKLSADRLQRFAEVQVLWDEHMARVARDYLDANPGKALVILAGSGHVAYQDAIPGRLTRMTGVQTAVGATGPREGFVEADVDFVLAERDIDLPEPGRVGMMLARNDRGVTVTDIPAASLAAQAGFRPGDLVLSIAGEPVQGMDDLRLALLDRAPGEQVWVEVVPSGAPARDSRQGRVLTLL